MSIQIGIARRAALAAAIGLGLVSCTRRSQTAGKRCTGPPATEPRTVVETPPPVDEPTPVAPSAGSGVFHWRSIPPPIRPSSAQSNGLSSRARSMYSKAR